MTRFDVHIHTALSACAENVLSPRQILSRARAARLDVIAVTDHNASANALVAVRLADAYGVRVIPGMEVASREEAHVLVFFEAAAALADFQELIDRGLPAEPNVPAVFGHQLVYDEQDEIVGIDERLRQVGTALTLEQVVAEAHQRGGLAVPAHVYRPRNSLWSQLGAIPAGAGFDAVELSRAHWRERGLRLGDRLAGYYALAGSDAHFLEDVGRFGLETREAAAASRFVLAALAAEDRP
jgi:predicted metal-dependent phosphoesterase TrpH